MENEVKQMEQTALAWPDRAKAVIITDQASYDLATGLLRDVATIEARIVEHHKSIKESAFKAHRTACAAEKMLLDPLVEAKSILKRAIGSWEQEQEIKRLQAQREAEASQAKLEEEARLAVAVEAEQNGATPETTEEILSTPILMPKPVVAPTFQRAQGVNTQQRWRAEVIDIKALCKAIAEGRASTEFVQANMVSLNALARAMKQTMSIPGVRAVPETTVAVRRAV